MSKPKVALLLKDDLYEEFLTPEVRCELESFADLWRPASMAGVTVVPGEWMRDVDACITSWGSPRFTLESVPEESPLKIIGHAAGTVKKLVDPQLFDRLYVVNAAGVIARYVGEMALTLTLASLRYITQQNDIMRQGGWKDDHSSWIYTDSLLGQTVGIVGLSQTGREFLRLLAPFDVKVLAYDPYVSAKDAATLGVQLASLEEVFSSCRVVSLHTPDTPETRGMIGSRLLGLMPDGALLVNTSRALVLEEAALVAELRSGRIYAALDVFHKEPPAADHPLRSMPNVILTPHMSGPVRMRRWEMLRHIGREVQRVCAGEKPLRAIRSEELRIMA